MPTPIDRRQVISWSLYDWANSAYATTVMAGFFPIFFKQYWSVDTDVTQSTFHLGVANSLASVLIAALVGFYSAIRFLIAGIANVIGLSEIRKWNATDWDMRYADHDPSEALPWDVVRHVVIIPAYKESIAVLRCTLSNLAAQYEARKRMTIVLAMEAAEDGCAEKAEQLQREYSRQFEHFYYTVHPRGLPGEMQCKSANEAWAARWAKRKLVDELGYNIDHILVTTMDADTLWHPKHFHALTCLFATHPQRHLRFWQAPIRYHGNIWQINPLLRLVNAYSGAFEQAQAIGIPT